LLSPLERKNGWHLAEAAGDATPDGVQDFLSRMHWDAEAVRDDLRAYVVEHLGDPDAVLVLDETGFLKKGDGSCGVARQYTGSVGKVTNCQLGVFAAYVSPHGHAFIDRALYLPKSWTSDPARRIAAHVPAAIGFATKPQLGWQMIRRAIDAGVPFAWVTGDTVYGVGALEMDLRKAGKGYVLGVNSDHQFHSWIGKPRVSGTAEAIAQGLAPSAWQRLSAGDGTKGPRLYDWAYLELADLDVSEYSSEQSGLWTRGLLIRRTIGDGECAYFTTWCPAGTPIETLVAVEGHRWAVEDGFETAKGELGLDHNETRSWHGWHRHVSLVMPAFAMLATIRHRANRGRKKNQPPTMPKRIQNLGLLVGAGDPPHRHSSGATAH
jgi:SRSO17 transposase